MRSVVTPPLTPPLKAISLLWTMIGVCSGKAISTSVLPSPTIDVGHAFSAALVSLATSLLVVQVGRPFALIAPFLSVSTTNSLSAGGWVPSMVSILPLTLRPIGDSFAFGSAVGLKPPSTVIFRFPSWMTTGLWFPAAAASPAATTASAVPRANVMIKTLAHVCISLLCGLASKPRPLKALVYPSRAKLPALQIR